MTIKNAAACIMLYLYIGSCDSNSCLSNDGNTFAQEVYDVLINNPCNTCIGRPYPKRRLENKYKPVDESNQSDTDYNLENKIEYDPGECDLNNDEYVTNDDDDEPKSTNKNNSKEDDDEPKTTNYNKPKYNNNRKKTTNYNQPKDNNDELEDNDVENYDKDKYDNVDNDDDEKYDNDDDDKYDDDDDDDNDDDEGKYDDKYELDCEID